MIEANDYYTPEQLAEVLRLSKYTVYAKIKKGEIPAFRLGRKMLIPVSEVETLLLNSRKSLSVEPQIDVTKRTVTVQESQKIFCGHDIILDYLGSKLEKTNDGLTILRSHVGSIQGLHTLYEGKASAAAIHLWDGNSGVYNIPFIRYNLPGLKIRLYHLIRRSEGFYVRRGNPKGIRGWADLMRGDISIVNRELGSGTRVLLDEKVRLLGYSGDRITGYYDIETTHIGIASRIARGGCDVGLGIEKVARQVDGIDFIPLQEESYDLVVLKEELQPGGALEHLPDVLSSSEFKQEINAMSGYNVEKMGDMILDL